MEAITAKIANPVENGRNHGGQKECTRQLTAVVNTRDGMKEAVDVRWWMGRSNQSSVVYCSVWMRGNGTHAAGHGSAGGYGYHKESAALDEALESAGVKLSKNINGAGDMAISEAVRAVVRALGYRGACLLVGH